MEIARYQRIAVYDGVLRIMHAWNGSLVCALTGLGWTQKFMEPGARSVVFANLHVTLGMALVVGLVARAVWGIVGPKHARFRAMWHPAEWKRALRRKQAGAKNPVGHDPRASGVYLLFYAALMGMAVTGVALAGLVHGRGPLSDALFDTVALRPWLEKPHEFGLYALTAFMVAHLTGMILHERSSGTPVAQSMVSGFQYRRVGGEEAGHVE